jgi:DNA-binding CsgD family transcriptional regulator
LRTDDVTDLGTSSDAASYERLFILPPNERCVMLFTSAGEGKRVVRLLRASRQQPALWDTGLDLTPAERDVGAALITGRSPAEIASSRGCSLHTVRSQIRAIYAKTGTRNRAELARLAWHRALTDLALPGQPHE